MVFSKRPGAVRLTLATLVVLHHTTTLRLGKFAVYSFFVLSGFWVTRIYRQKYAGSSNGALRFYASRILRIFPIYVLCTTLALVLFHRHELTAGFMARTFSVPVHELIGTNVLPPVWSLDVELQFYLLVPLLAFVGATMMIRGLPRAAQGALGLISALGLVLVKATVFKFGLFFAIGIFLAQTRPAFPRIVARLSLVATGLVGLVVWRLGSPGFHDTYPAEVLLTLLFVPVMAESVRQPGSMADRQIGELSYPLYLFHWLPAYSLRAHVGYYAGHEFTLGDLPRIALCWAISFAGAYVIWRFVDLPLERRRRAWLEPAAERSEPELGDTALSRRVQAPR